MARFEDAINAVLADEGDLSDDPNDPGGITRWGISLRFYQEIKPDATADDIRNLTRDMAVEIYHKMFWDKYKYNFIANQTLATKVFDIAVNISPGQANKLLQRAVNTVNQYAEGTAQYLVVDGVLGTLSLYAINNSPQTLLLAEFKKILKAYYIGLVAVNPKLKEFLSDWLKRASQDN